MWDLLLLLKSNSVLIAENDYRKFNSGIWRHCELFANIQICNKVNTSFEVALVVSMRTLLLVVAKVIYLYYYWYSARSPWLGRCCCVRLASRKWCFARNPHGAWWRKREFCCMESSERANVCIMFGWWYDSHMGGSPDLLICDGNAFRKGRIEADFYFSGKGEGKDKTVFGWEWRAFKLAMGMARSWPPFVTDVKVVQDNQLRLTS